MQTDTDYHKHALALTCVVPRGKCFFLHVHFTLFPDTPPVTTLVLHLPTLRHANKPGQTFRYKYLNIGCLAYCPFQLPGLLLRCLATVLFEMCHNISFRSSSRLSKTFDVGSTLLPDLAGVGIASHDVRVGTLCVCLAGFSNTFSSPSFPRPNFFFCSLPEVKVRAYSIRTRLNSALGRAPAVKSGCAMCCEEKAGFP